MGEPKPIFPVYLTTEEANQIIAVYEKTGAFASVIAKIRAAQSTKGIK